MKNVIFVWNEQRGHGRRPADYFFGHLRLKDTFLRGRAVELSETLERNAMAGVACSIYDLVGDPMLLSVGWIYRVDRNIGVEREGASHGRRAHPDP
jgi:hypothetical protein